MGSTRTVALGEVVAFQLWELAEEDLGDLDDQFERGDFGTLRDWLRENVHRHGRAFNPQKLLQPNSAQSEQLKKTKSHNKDR